MDIRSVEQWCWGIDGRTQTLAVQVGGEYRHHTPYRLADLNTTAAIAGRWNLDDLGWLLEALESISQHLTIDEAQALPWAVAAVAARNFYASRQPKSWLFLPSTARLTLSAGNVVELQHAHGHATLLVVDAGDPASTLMLLDEALIIDGQRPLRRGAILRMMNDRVQRYAATAVAGSWRDVG
ncbi:MAG: cell division protein ZapC [Gammaproteobacteria bacterium]|nr:cell division protein ZapC [Gammaproteobacteria bacterium]